MPEETRQPGGMPEQMRRIPEHLRRTVPMTTWLSEQDAKDLEADAKNLEKPVSAYMREIIIGRRRVRVIRKEAHHV